MNIRIAAVVAGLTICITMVAWSAWSRPATVLPHATATDEDRPQTSPAKADPAACVREAAAVTETLAPTASTADAPPTDPEAATLTVRFLDPDGSAAKATGRLTLSRYVSLGAGSMITPAGELDVDASVVQVPGVTRGEYLALELAEPGRLAAKNHVQMPAGLRHHEVILVRGLSSPQLEIALVDERSQPITDREFLLFVRLGQGFPEYYRKTPNQHGVIRILLPRAGSGAVEIGEPHQDGVLHTFAGERLKRPYNTSIGAPPPPDIAYSVRPFPHMEPGAKHRLPEVVVHVPRPRLTGTVLGLDGKPAPGVEILVGSPTTPEPAPFRHFKTTTNGSGAFAIVAGSLPSHIYVCARGTQLFSNPKRVATQDHTPMVLQLQPTGAVSLSVRASPHLQQLHTKHRGTVTPEVALTIDSKSLRDGSWVYFRNHSSMVRSVGPVWNRTLHVRGASPIMITDLVPQAYDVHFFVHGNRDLHLREVVVRTGRVTSPAILNNYVIGGEIAELAVRVRNPDGTPPTQAFVIIHLPEQAHAAYHLRSASTDANGDATFFLPRTTVADVEVQSYGRRSQRVRAASLPLEIVLDAGTQIAVAIDGLGAITDAKSFSVSARKHDDQPMLTPLMSAPDALWPPHASVHATSGTASLSNLEPGNYRVWLVSHQKAKHAPARFLVLRDLTIDADTPKTIELHHQLTAEQAMQLSR